jgi:UTP-glucose-1-phosphate uridylyltransferase
MLIESDTVEAFNMTGKSHDCGDKLGYMTAFVDMVCVTKSWVKSFVSNY